MKVQATWFAVMCAIVNFLNLPQISYQYLFASTTWTIRK